MSTLTFRIVPVSTEVADQARRSAEVGAPDHAVMTVDAPNSYPCRHCLRWAAPGERVVLFPFASIPSGRPYAESGPIFVHAEPCAQYSALGEYPADFRNGRMLRAYDAAEVMIDARAITDGNAESAIGTFLANPEIAFLQVRSADRGCYTMRIERP